MNAEIRIAATENEMEEARHIFQEYQNWLGFDLCFQNFDAELKGLPGRYAPPDGRLYLLYIAGEVQGCIGLRRFDGSRCEMKRLYIRPAARGSGFGSRLVEKIIADAREIGYFSMLLDTYPPKMGEAAKIYGSHGFLAIPPYYHNPYDGVVFMELVL